MKTRDKYSNFINNTKTVVVSLGLMSGTSLDGVDIALIKTDANQLVKLGSFKTYRYSNTLINKIKEFIINRNNIKDINLLITRFHAVSIKSFLNNFKIKKSEIDIIGFHGQTIFHSPEQRWTWQLGDGQYLSNLVNIPVISNFRYRDICLGGQGAPLVAIWHKVLSQSISKQKYPCVFLNIGGVSNITYIENMDDLPYSFDIGVGNGPLDLVMQKYYKKQFDMGGTISLKGNINYKILNNILEDSWFKTSPPKSMDKNYLNNLIFFYLDKLKSADMAANIAKLISLQLKVGCNFFNKQPKSLYISGGGAKNVAISNGIKEEFNEIILSLLDNNWNADAMEAQAFAYLASRSLKSLPYTWNKVTGVSSETSGGVINFPK